MLENEIQQLKGKNLVQIVARWWIKTAITAVIAEKAFNEKGRHPDLPRTFPDTKDCRIKIRQFFYYDNCIENFILGTIVHKVFRIMIYNEA